MIVVFVETFELIWKGSTVSVTVLESRMITGWQVRVDTSSYLPLFLFRLFSDMFCASYGIWHLSHILSMMMDCTYNTQCNFHCFHCIFFTILLLKLDAIQTDNHSNFRREQKQSESKLFLSSCISMCYTVRDCVHTCTCIFRSTVDTWY